jgi:hypothetical protein
VPRHLGDDVCRGAEPVEPEPLGVAGETKCAVTDQPGAEERRGFEISEPVRDRKAKALVRDNPFGVAAVEVEAGEARAVAEILAARATEQALAARPAELRHAEPAAVVRLAHDLVARNERQLRTIELAVHDVQVGTADSAGPNAQQEVARPRARRRHVPKAQLPSSAVENHGPHRLASQAK